jgi:hypothetical protein
VQVTRVLDGRRKAIEAAWREKKRDERSDSLKPSPSGLRHAHIFFDDCVAAVWEW